MLLLWDGGTVDWTHVELCCPRTELIPVHCPLGSAPASCDKSHTSTEEPVCPVLSDKAQQSAGSLVFGQDKRRKKDMNHYSWVYWWQCTTTASLFSSCTDLCSVLKLHWRKPAVVKWEAFICLHYQKAIGFLGIEVHSQGWWDLNLRVIGCTFLLDKGCYCRRE